MTVEEGDALENSLFEAHTFLASFLCNRMLLTQLPTVGHKICIEQICFTAPPVRNLHNLRKILRPFLLFLSKMLCCLQLSLAPCMLNESLKFLRLKLLLEPISSTLKENAQPGLKLVLTGLPIFPVQHLTTRPSRALLTMGGFNIIPLFHHM